jgi:YD repeat-containing protein
MNVIKLSLIVLSCCFINNTIAQTIKNTYKNKSGNPVGYSKQQGNKTTYYNKQGNKTGSAKNTNGNTTTFYNKQGNKTLTTKRK